MKIIFFIAAIILSGMAATNVSAQNNRTLRDEDRRIQQGVISGQLTDEETARLKIQEAHLRNAAPLKEGAYSGRKEGLTGISAGKSMTGKEGFNSII